MKKLVKTVAILMAAAVAVGSFVGCSSEAPVPQELGKAPKDWKGQDKVKGDPATEYKAQTVALTIDNIQEGDTVDWVVWTDKDSQILASQPTIKEVGGNSVTTLDDIGTDGGALAKDKTYIFQFTEKGNYTLNLHISGTNRDWRGEVSVDDKNCTKIKLSGAREEVRQQCSFFLINNEPVDAGWIEGGQASYFNNKNRENTDETSAGLKDLKGDYTINEVWVLEPSAYSGLYRTTDSLKHKGLKIEGKQGNTKEVGFLIPADAPVVVTTYQGSRAKLNSDKSVEYKSSDISDTKKHTISARANAEKWCLFRPEVKTKDKEGNDICVDGEYTNKPFITSAQRQKKEDEYWGKIVNFDRYGVTKPKAVNGQEKESTEIIAHGKTTQAIKTASMADLRFNRKSDDFTKTKAAMPGEEVYDLHVGVDGEK